MTEITYETLYAFADRVAKGNYFDWEVEGIARGHANAWELEVEEYEATEALRHTADVRAMLMWQKAHPESKHVWPDHGDLVVFLMAQYDNQRQALKNIISVTQFECEEVAAAHARNIARKAILEGTPEGLQP